MIIPFYLTLCCVLMCTAAFVFFVIVFIHGFVVFMFILFSFKGYQTAIPKGIEDWVQSVNNLNDFGGNHK